jgi:hypothetical protein
MVQGEGATYSSVSMYSRTPEARAAAYDAVNKVGKKDAPTTKQQEQNKYGAWGPVYKNKSHFASLHHC